jgi:hypothetical protein
MFHSSETLSLGDFLGDIQDIFTLSTSGTIHDDIGQQGYLCGLNVKIPQTDALYWICVCEMRVSGWTTEDFGVIDCADQTTGSITAKGCGNMDDGETSVADVYGWKTGSL